MSDRNRIRAKRREYQRLARKREWESYIEMTPIPEHIQVQVSRILREKGCVQSQRMCVGPQRRHPMNTRKVWTYFGVYVFPADRNTSGIRWYADMGIGMYLKADTKEGMRELIRRHRDTRRSQ